MKEMIHLRPQERVRQYLERNISQLGLAEGARLPTARELARKLEVSTRTVLKVYKDYSDRGYIVTKVGNGTFLKTPMSGSAGQLETYRIGALLGRELTHRSPARNWLPRIYSGVLHAIAGLDKTTSFLPMIAEDTLDPCLEHLDDVDGLIMFPHEQARNVVTTFEEAGKPCVFINPPCENATASFVSADYFGASFKIGYSWRKSGRQKVLLVFGPVDISVSTRLRLSGVFSAFGALVGNGISLDVLEIPSAEQDFSRERFLQYLNAHAMPDAVYCAGDFQAMGVIEALTGKGISVPEDCSVIGGSGFDLSHTSYPSLTRMLQPMEQMGSRAVTMLTERIRMSRDLPGDYLTTPFAGWGTTRDEENDILRRTVDDAFAALSQEVTWPPASNGI